MRTRRALVAGLVLTVVLALSALGVRDGGTETRATQRGGLSPTNSAASFDEVATPEPPPLTEPRQNPRWSATFILLGVLLLTALLVGDRRRVWSIRRWARESTSDAGPAPSRPRAPPAVIAG